MNKVLHALALLTPVALSTAAAAQSQEQRWNPRLDHVILAVEDLEATAQLFRDSLGFRLGPRARLPNGMENVVLGLGDTTYLELLAIYDDEKAPPRITTFLATGEGAPTMALRVSSADRTAALLRTRGFAATGPLSGTAAVRGGDAPAEMFRYVLFTEKVLPNNLFFVEYDQEARARMIERLPPEERDFAAHPNTASGLMAVWVAVGDLASASAAYESLGLELEETAVVPPTGADGRCVRVARGCILLLLSPADTGIVGVTLRVDDMRAAGAAIVGDPPSAYDGVLGPSIRIPSRRARGLFIELVER